MKTEDAEEQTETSSQTHRNKKNETVVRSGTAGTNPTDSTFNFNSLWILLTWRELQLALTTNVLQRETFYSDTLSTCQSL